MEDGGESPHTSRLRLRDDGSLALATAVPPITHTAPAPPTNHPLTTHLPEVGHVFGALAARTADLRVALAAFPHVLQQEALRFLGWKLPGVCGP